MKDESWLLFWSGAQGYAWGVVISYLLYQISVISASTYLCFLVLILKWLPDSAYSHSQIAFLEWKNVCSKMLKWPSVLFVKNGYS